MSGQLPIPDMHCSDKQENHNAAALVDVSNGMLTQQDDISSSIFVKNENQIHSSESPASASAHEGSSISGVDRQNEEDGEGQPEERTDDKEEQEEEEEFSLEQTAEIVLRIVRPVTLCMFIVWLVTSAVRDETSAFSNMLAYDNTGSSKPASTQLGGALVNGLIILGVIFIATLVLVLLYKYRCVGAIYGWLIVSATFMIFYFGGSITKSIFTKLNLPLDTITFVFVLANLGVCAGLSMFFFAAPKITQFYMILISVLMATEFSLIPPPTWWILLILVSLYDIFAVLSPNGPLHHLVKTSHERQEPIPALVYSGGTVVMSAVHDIKLGLGDFIFYGVLIARASEFGLVTVLSCYFAIVSGLCLTLFFLIVYQRALPALPFSILFGLFAYVVAGYCLDPYLSSLNQWRLFL